MLFFHCYGGFCSCFFSAITTLIEKTVPQLPPPNVDNPPFAWEDLKIFTGFTKMFLTDLETVDASYRLQYLAGGLTGGWRKRAAEEGNLQRKGIVFDPARTRSVPAL